VIFFEVDLRSHFDLNSQAEVYPVFKKTMSAKTSVRSFCGRWWMFRNGRWRE